MENPTRTRHVADGDHIDRCRRMCDKRIPTHLERDLPLDGADGSNCPDCLLLCARAGQATYYRRREIDQWLSEVGAHVIHVTDLGAALEANHCGRAALFVAHLFASHGGPEDGPAWTDRNVPAIYAAHLARAALGES